MSNQDGFLGLPAKECVPPGIVFEPLLIRQNTENIMSKTYKTQRAYQAHHTDYDNIPYGSLRRHAMDNALRDAGIRYGNQRRMRAKLKVAERRIRRKRENRSSEDTE